MGRNTKTEECLHCPVNPTCNALYRGKLCTILRRSHGLDKPMTNSARIRSMSDVEWVTSGHFPCPYNVDGQGACKFAEEERTQTCEECKLEWLSLIG